MLESLTYLTESALLKYILSWFSRYVTFTKEGINELEHEFIFVLSISFEVLPMLWKKKHQHVLMMRVDYSLLHCWFFVYLHEMKIAGTNGSKFSNFFQLVRIVLSVVHSNAEKESLFPRVRKCLKAHSLGWNNLFPFFSPWKQFFLKIFKFLFSLFDHEEISFTKAVLHYTGCKWNVAETGFFALAHA